MGTYYGPDWLRPYAQAFWYPKEWLNGLWSKRDQMAFDDLYNLNVLGYQPFKTEFDNILNSRNREKYFGRYNMDYSDIADPRNALGTVTSSASFSNILRLSDNFKRLYR